ncbi:hypothetical protein PIROE2DRAFT_7580 [Piromyces sp. E2]|nr:hypothetical protein PIROE2DRAFT_7580 [Piromyces sp. E2]|eukprot:OUM65372.1 hypothetical protein PIROE2DRAFT_7580 [Piromyces sp. E2]
MNCLYHILLYIYLILNLVRHSISSSTFSSYFNKIESVNVEGESSQCLSVYNLFKDCIISRNKYSAIDFNDICETFNNGTCQIIQKSMDKTLSKCSSRVQNELTNIINENYSILTFFCYKDSDNEYCPISELFQKYITINEDISIDHFKNTNYLNDLCKAKSCYSYIDDSYKVMKTLFKVGIVKNENILNTESDTNSYIKSQSCQNFLAHNLVVLSKEYSIEDDYLNILDNIEKSSNLQPCISIINSYSECLINYHDSDTLPDYNKYCDIYNTEYCKNLFNNINVNIKKCEDEYQVKLSKALTSIRDISNLFCFRSHSDEFCPISKIFQKSKTVKEEIKGDSFYDLNLLQNYCLDESCAQFIDESYIGIYDLYNIGLVTEESIMKSLKYIRDFIDSPECSRIRKNYGRFEKEDSSSSFKQYKLSLCLVIVTIIVSYNFLI